VNSIEDRLRDAYRGAAETVDPDTVRQLHERSATISAFVTRPDSRLHRRLMVPLAAASAVALIAVVTAVVIPAALDRARHAPQAVAGPAGRYVVQLSSGNQARLTVRALGTGMVVAKIPAPKPGMTFTDVASGDGKTYVAVLARAGLCRNWLYRFRLGNSGHPTALTTLTVIRRSVTKAALSKDNSTLALATQQCPQGRRALPAELAVVNLATSKTRQWPLPRPSRVSLVSLTADGSLLAFTFSSNQARASVYVLHTNAQPGSAIQRSHVVAAAARFGARANIRTAVITPDGSTVYFTTNPGGSAPAGHWQLRAFSLATGHTRVVGRYAGIPGDLAADPSVTRVLVVVRQSHGPTPSPVPSPSHPRADQPTPSASLSYQPTPSPSPSRHRSPEPTPSPSPSRSRGTGTARLELITLSSGAPRFLSSPAWAPQATLAYYW
jgi:Tol biopolymer transport system component